MAQLLAAIRSNNSHKVENWGEKHVRRHYMGHTGTLYVKQRHFMGQRDSMWDSQTLYGTHRHYMGLTEMIWDTRTLCETQSYIIWDAQT